MPQSQNEVLPCGWQYQVRAMPAEVYGLRLLCPEEARPEAYEVRQISLVALLPLLIGVRPGLGDDNSAHTSHEQIRSREVPTTIPTAECMDISATSTAPQHALHDTEDASSSFLAEVDGLQPSSLLNKKATTGKFSMETILSIGKDLDSDPAQSPSALPEGDPVLKGITSYHVATSLFEG